MLAHKCPPTSGGVLKRGTWVRVRLELAPWSVGNGGQFSVRDCFGSLHMVLTVDEIAPYDMMAWNAASIERLSTRVCQRSSTNM